jgi:hypothetical protein
MARKAPTKSFLADLFMVHRWVSIALVFPGCFCCSFSASGRGPHGWMQYIIPITFSLFWLLDLPIRIYIRYARKLDDPWWLFSGITGRFGIATGSRFLGTYQRIITLPWWTWGVLLIGVCIASMIQDYIKQSKIHPAIVQNSSDARKNTSSSPSSKQVFEVSYDEWDGKEHLTLTSHYPKKLSKVSLVVKCTWEQGRSTERQVTLPELSPSVPVKTIFMSGAIDQRTGVALRTLAGLEVDGTGEDEQGQVVPIKCKWSEK